MKQSGRSLLLKFVYSYIDVVGVRRLPIVHLVFVDGVSADDKSGSEVRLAGTVMVGFGVTMLLFNPEDVVVEVGVNEGDGHLVFNELLTGGSVRVFSVCSSVGHVVVGQPTRRFNFVVAVGAGVGVDAFEEFDGFHGFAKVDAVPILARPANERHPII